MEWKQSVLMSLILHAKQKLSYVEECLPCSETPVIAATDYMRAYPEQIRGYINGPITHLVQMVMEEVILEQNFESFLK